MPWFASPWDAEASVDFLQRFNIPVYKIHRIGVASRMITCCVTSARDWETDHSLDGNEYL
jgi:hypothetical protein